jgi:subtilisin-like proprotein convertase family protein
MKKIALMLLVIVLTGRYSNAQIAYSPYVDSIIQLADHNSVLLLTRQLAGDTSVTVNGELVTITSRHYLNPGNSVAADFIFERFEEYGYTPEVFTFSNGRGENVLAKKTGTKYPEKEYIICGHYDDMPSGSNSPGADDNASGTVAVLEAARLFANLEFDYTIRFAAWDEEEIGLVGSKAYANFAAMQGRQIMGVLNLDMIAWDSDDDFTYTIATNTASQAFSNDFITTAALYEPQLNHNFYFTTASDHASFWNAGYPAMLAIEDWYDFNEFYHSPQDDIDILNMDYYVSMLRASLANIAAQAWDQRINLEHDAVISGNSTDTREAVLVVNSSQSIDKDNFPPRLYYSVNDGPFEFVLPISAEDNTFTFMIPGFPIISEVKYYFALQDSAARMMATLPAGGKGINPAGTQAPENSFSYLIDHIVSVFDCSQTTPLPITDFQNTYDNIELTGQGEVMDLNLNVNITHTRTGDLRLIVIGPDGTVVLLSDKNGGNGDNYTNTTFDDDALLLITEGTPPFTGSYRPQMLLSAFNDRPINGTWQLRVNDGGSGNTGTLDSWCLQILYRDATVNVEDFAAEAGDLLLQNYPNPAPGVTNIRFRLDRPSQVRLLVYDLYGKQVAELANSKFDAGNHLLVAGLRHLAPGRYFYQLITDKVTLTKPLVLTR